MNPMHKNLPKGKELDALLRAYKAGLTATWDETKHGYIVPSQSSPGDKYLVRHGQCYCTGFLRWGMCKHVAIANEQYLLDGKAWRCACGEMFYSDKTYDVSEYDRVHGNHMLNNGEVVSEDF